jgi:hypothetical protein
MATPGRYLHADGCTHEIGKVKTAWQMRRLSTVSGQWGEWYSITEEAINRLLGFGQLTKL